MTAQRVFVYAFFVAIAAYAIVGIVSPRKLVSREKELEPLVPYWMRELFIYDSEKKVRKACVLFLAIAIAGLASVGASA